MAVLEKKLKNIISSWFMKEPLLFAVTGNNNFVQNQNLKVPMRTGVYRIEYSPILLEKASDEQLENYLKIEAFRILLGHPYARQPYNAKAGILLLASDITIYQNCGDKIDCSNLSGVLYLKNQAIRFGMLKDPLPPKWRNTDELKFFQRNLVVDSKTGKLLLQDKLSFEQWYRRILFLIQETSIAGENAGTGNGLLTDAEDAAELWEENQELQTTVNQQIQKAEADQGWGGLGGNIQRELKNQADFSFDYRRALAHFRQNIVSANRKLTRMRPSRRYGFNAMGSRYERKANILIAVDVSGSITDDSFNHFYKAINNFFFLGIIERIDLIFFDVNLKNTTPITFKKKIELDSIKGRGGTNFQPPIDFFEANSTNYSGLIIFTDGEGPIPLVKSSTSNILWILDSRLAYEKSRQWIATLQGCKSTYLPF